MGLDAKNPFERLKVSKQLTNFSSAGAFITIEPIEDIEEAAAY